METVLSRLLDYDPVTASVQKFHFGGTDGEFYIETLQRVDPILEANKAQYNMVDERSRFGGEWHKVASIDMNTYMRLQREGILDDDEAFSKWLNDRDNLKYRTRPGIV